MSKACRFLSIAVGFAVICVCVWLSVNVLSTSSKYEDTAIAMVCDYARPQDAATLNTLIGQITSPFWAEYARSRLQIRMDGSADHVAKRVLEEYSYAETRAYVLATQALHIEGLENWFVSLPPCEAELAGLIYAVNKGIHMDSDVFSDFFDRYLKKLSQRNRRHYEDILLTQALKKNDMQTAEMIFKAMPQDSLHVYQPDWAFYFVLKGARPEQFTYFSKGDAATLSILREALDTADGDARKEMLESLNVSSKKIAIYYFYGFKCRAVAMWKLGGQSEALSLLRHMYKIGVDTVMIRGRTEAVTASVQALAVCGDSDYVDDFIDSSAGERELILRFTGDAALAAARAGEMDAAMRILKNIEGLEGRFGVAFRYPRYPLKNRY